MMLRVLDYVTADLPPTRTYGRRSYCWVPADPTHPNWDGRLGNLTIRLQHARSGWGRDIELDTYSVIEQPPSQFVMGRDFLLLNLTDQEQQDVYEVRIGPVEDCTCIAGRVAHYEC